MRTCDFPRCQHLPHHGGPHAVWSDGVGWVPLTEQRTRENKAAALQEKAEQIARAEIDAYAENLTPDEETAFRRRAEVWRDLITAAALAALTETENAR